MAVTQRSKSPAAQRPHRESDEKGMPHLALAEGRPAVEHPDLMATIESEIIPRLMLAHRTGLRSTTTCADSRLPPTQSELQEFARIATCHDLSLALGFVESLCRQGLSLEAVLLDLVAPTARLLGEQWQADLRSFTEVSAGLGTLQQVVHVLSPSFAPGLPHRGLVVLVSAPGEQHTLGLYMVGEFLRRAGWGVQVAPSMSEAEILDVVVSEHVEMLGISVSNSELLEPLSALLAAVRRVSRNPNLAVMLGGALDLRGFAAQNHASLCTTDPRDAVRWLELHAMVERCKS